MGIVPIGLKKQMKRYLERNAERIDAVLGDVDLKTLSIGENTEIFETDGGSTVLVNSAGNPINIQLYPSGRAFLVGNDSTETVIDTQNEWVEIEGNWDSAHMNYLDHDGIGGLIYRGDVTTQIDYISSGAYVSPSNNAVYEIGIFKDGELKTRTPVDFSPPRQDENLPLPTIPGFTDEMTPDMRHSVRVRCTNGTHNITVNTLSFRIRG